LRSEQRGDRDGEDDDGIVSEQDEDSNDVYGLQAEKKEDEQRLGSEDDEAIHDGDKLLFGLKADPYGPKESSDEEEEPPPPPVVGVRISFGRPTFAPVQPDILEDEESAEDGLPLGLRGPFTTATDEDGRERVAGFNDPAAETDDPFAQALLVRAARAKEEEALAAAEKQRAEQAAATSTLPSFGLAEGVGLRVGGEALPSSRVNGRRSPYATSAQGLGRDPYRLPNEESQGAFGSTGKVAQYVAAYLRQASGASSLPVAGQVVSTVG
jgi:hypothetical protein